MASRHYSKRRSNDEWMALVTECRQSGLTDDAWCQQNGISISSFYNAVHRLREQACAIPEHANNNPVMNLTASAPDVVQFSIIPEKSPEPTVTMTLGQETSYLDNSHTIEISAFGSRIRISNDADPVLLKQVLSIMRDVQ